MTGRKILVIGDAHARPDQDNTRFDALGRFIVDKRPDVVVSIGDWADMPSLCHYDKGQRAAEGRRYQDDVYTSLYALESTMRPVRDAYRRSKKKLPEFYITLGNHENRCDRAANAQPELYGKLSSNDLGFKEQGWKVVPFLQPIVLEGICFQHYLPSGPMGRPTAGVNHARTLIMKAMMSTVVGHSHLRDFYETTRADGTKMFGLVVGCYDEGEHEYAKATQSQWWSGLCMIHEAHDGTGEPAFYSMSYIKGKYL